MPATTNGTTSMADLMSAAPGAATALPVWDPAASGWCITIWGQEGSGKTHFYLTAPTPIFVFDFEGNIGETIRNFPHLDNTNTRIYGPIPGTPVNKYKIPMLGEQPLAYNEFMRFKNDFTGLLAFLDQRKVRATIVIDSVTQLWELIRLAIVPLDPKTGKVIGSTWEYGPANAAYSAVFTETARDRNHLLVCAARAKERWVEKKKMDGQFDAHFKMMETPHNSSVVVQAMIAPRFVGGKGQVNRSYRMTKVQPNVRLVGFETENLDYATLVSLIEAM